jgi:UDP-N-acetylglucosamine:LPS N-acetylglucosamine transferase
MIGDDFVELCEMFFELENDLDLLNRRICDVCFWERVRFPVHGHLRRSLVDSTDDKTATSSKDYLSGIRLLLSNCLVRNPVFSPDADLLFYGTGRRKHLEDGQWWDIYHDPIMESLTEDCLMWERPYKLTHLTPSKTSNLRYVDMVEYTGTLLQKLGISTVSFSEDEISFLKTVENEISSRFGVDVPLLSMVEKDLSKRRVCIPMYRNLLNRASPFIIFMTVSYGGRETFVEACQLEGIPVIELQHGAISRYHMAYSFPYDKKRVFPDYFFSFGDFWSELVDLPLPDERVYSVGYPYLEAEAKKYDGIKTNKQTVFISQGSIGKELSRFAVALNNRDDYENDIVYKLHPREYDSWQDDYPWLNNAKLRVVDSDDPPLYHLFAKSTAQVGVGSTAVYEGLNFGLDTYVLDIESENHKLKYLIDKGYAKLVRSPAELLDKQEISVDRCFDPEPIFNSEPIENITEALESIRTNDI